MQGILSGLKGSFSRKKKDTANFRTYPVISLSFANIKSGDYKSFLQRRCQLLTEFYRKIHFCWKGISYLTKKGRSTVKSAWTFRKWLSAWQSTDWQDICSATMGKNSSFCWMNTIYRCRKHMCMATGKRRWHSPEIFSTRHSRRILGLSVWS